MHRRGAVPTDAAQKAAPRERYFIHREEVRRKPNGCGGAAVAELIICFQSPQPVGAAGGEVSAEAFPIAGLKKSGYCLDDRMQLLGVRIALPPSAKQAGPS